MSNPVPRTYGYTPVERVRSRTVQRSLEAIAGQHELVLARIDAQTAETAAVIQARNALGAAVAQADATLSAILSALPIYDATDADFRAQIKQAARAGAIADLFRFNP